jgi:sec-independent protein translocase protein TatC
MSLLEHLGELRKRLFIALAAIAVGAIVAFVFYSTILGWLQTPYCDAVPNNDCRFLVTAPLDAFGLRLQIATYGGLILASPVVLWQLWSFIAPGLKAREKKYAIPFIVSSMVLFAFGGLIAYLTAPKALNFLLTIGGSELNIQLNPVKYLSLIMLMILAFGASFEFPVLLVFLQIVNAVTPRRLAGWRRPAIVVIVIFAAVITPSQDPYSLFAMAVPMYVFYELSILIGKYILKK